MLHINQSEIDAIRSELGFINKARSFTKEKIEQMKKVIDAENLPATTVVVSNGSYARCEASQQSDLDFLLICDEDDQVDAAKRNLLELGPKLFAISGKPPSAEGAFGDVHSLQSILSNIGGDDDLNQSITRRVLFYLKDLACPTTRP